jgi:hypothetical protein
MAPVHAEARHSLRDAWVAATPHRTPSPAATPRPVQAEQAVSGRVRRLLQGMLYPSCFLAGHVASSTCRSNFSPLTRASSNVYWQALGFVPQALVQFVSGLGWTSPDEGTGVLGIDELAETVLALTLRLLVLHYLSIALFGKRVGAVVRMPGHGERRLFISTVHRAPCTTSSQGML